MSCENVGDDHQEIVSTVSWVARFMGELPGESFQECSPTQLLAPTSPRAVGDGVSCCWPMLSLGDLCIFTISGPPGGLVDFSDFRLQLISSA